jgi:hypothetical protein
MKISFIIPRWPKDSFWDVIAFKFPLLSTSLLAGLTPNHHQIRIIDESLTEIDFNQEVDLVAITAMTPLAPRGYEIADEFRRRGRKVVIGGIHASWLLRRQKPIAKVWPWVKRMKSGWRYWRMLKWER